MRAKLKCIRIIKLTKKEHKRNKYVCIYYFTHTSIFSLFKNIDSCTITHTHAHTHKLIKPSLSQKTRLECA